jgi:iron(III) transport system substrate-binding protein
MQMKKTDYKKSAVSGQDRGQRGIKALFAAMTVILLFSVIAVAGWAKSRELTIYTPLEDDQVPRYLESFKAKYPDIKLNIVRDSTGVITAKLLAEKNNPRADVVWGCAASSLLVLDDEGMLEAYAPQGVERVTPSFRDKANPPKWVGIDAWMTAFTVNKVELAKRKLPMPKSFADLINPVYKGLITMPNPASSGTGFLTVSGILQLLGEKKGWEYLDKLHANISQYVHSGSKPAKLAGQGECVIGISFDYRGIVQKQKGDPVEVIFPKEGSGWDVEANALIRKKDIKPEARLFLDWALTADVMKEYNKSYAILSIKDGAVVPAGYPADPVKQLAKNDLMWAAKKRAAILDEWSKRYDSKSESK